MAANAAIEQLPPLILFKGKNLWDSWMAAAGEEYPEIAYATTKNGWMEAETFSTYLIRSFIQKTNSP